MHVATNDRTNINESRKSHQAKIMTRRVVFLRPRISFMIYKFIWHENLLSCAEYKIQKQTSNAVQRNAPNFKNVSHKELMNFFFLFFEKHMWIILNICVRCIIISLLCFHNVHSSHCTHCTCNCARIQLQKLLDETCCKNVPKIRCKAMLVSNLGYIPYSIHNFSEIFQMTFEWSESDCRILIRIFISHKSFKN